MSISRLRPHRRMPVGFRPGTTSGPGPVDIGTENVSTGRWWCRRSRSASSRPQPPQFPSSLDCVRNTTRPAAERSAFQASAAARDPPEPAHRRRPMQGPAEASGLQATTRPAAKSLASRQQMGSSDWRRVPRWNMNKAPPSTQHADGGGRDDAGKRRHGFEPPRGPQAPLLWCRLDPHEGGLDRVVGRPSRTGIDPRPSSAFERAVVGHASRPSWGTGSASAARASRSPAIA